jgi:hypothetical protein
VPITTNAAGPSPARWERDREQLERHGLRNPAERLPHVSRPLSSYRPGTVLDTGGADERLRGQGSQGLRRIDPATRSNARQRRLDRRDQSTRRQTALAVADAEAVIPDILTYASFTVGVL